MKCDFTQVQTFQTLNTNLCTENSSCIRQFINRLIEFKQNLKLAVFKIDLYPSMEKHDTEYIPYWY